MIKTPQLMVGLFLGMLGIAMIINFWGEMNISAIVSDIVGLILIALGALTFFLYMRQKRGAKQN